MLEDVLVRGDDEDKPKDDENKDKWEPMGVEPTPESQDGQPSPPQPQR